MGVSCPQLSYDANNLANNAADFRIGANGGAHASAEEPERANL
jgi:hypothetical protein